MKKPSNLQTLRRTRWGGLPTSRTLLNQELLIGPLACGARSHQDNDGIFPEVFFLGRISLSMENWSRESRIFTCLSTNSFGMFNTVLKQTKQEWTQYCLQNQNYSKLVHVYEKCSIMFRIVQIMCPCIFWNTFLFTENSYW